MIHEQIVEEMKKEADDTIHRVIIGVGIGETDYNTAKKELDTLITTTSQRVREETIEEVRYTSILPTWIDEEPAWTLVAIQNNNVTWVSENPIKQSVISSAYYRETGQYAMSVISVGEVSIGARRIHQEHLPTLNK